MATTIGDSNRWNQRHLFEWTGRQSERINYSIFSLFRRGHVVRWFYESLYVCVPFCLVGDTIFLFVCHSIEFSFQAKYDYYFDTSRVYKIKASLGSKRIRFYGNSFEEISTYIRSVKFLLFLLVYSIFARSVELITSGKWSLLRSPNLFNFNFLVSFVSHNTHWPPSWYTVLTFLFPAKYSFISGTGNSDYGKGVILP